jgi:hypothetical protein
MSLAMAAAGSVEAAPSWGQVRALSDWMNWWQDGRSVAARNLRSVDLKASIPDPQRFFSTPVQIFGQLWFLGALSKRQVKVKWSHGHENFLGLSKTSASEHGMCLSLKLKSPANAQADCATILLNPRINWHFLNPKAILCTLLHEMVHEFVSHAVLINAKIKDIF